MQINQILIVLFIIYHPTKPSINYMLDIVFYIELCNDICYFLFHFHHERKCCCIKFLFARIQKSPDIKRYQNGIISIFFLRHLYFYILFPVYFLSSSFQYLIYLLSSFLLRLIRHFHNLRNLHFYFLYF